MPTLYTKSCQQCKSLFEVLPRDKNKKLCTLTCAREFRRNPNKLPHCLYCNKDLNEKHQMRFCSNSCSAKYNNSKKDFTKIKTGPKPREKNEKSLFSTLYKCKCKHCGVEWRGRIQQRICDEHASLYSHEGRAKYWFTFSISSYPDIFDGELLRKHGMRSKSNPNGVTRDHKVSVDEAIRNGYDPYYIKHPLNCELMLFKDNAKKNTKSSISYADLVSKVDEYDKMVGRVGLEPTTKGFWFV